MTEKEGFVADGSLGNHRKELFPSSREQATVHRIGTRFVNDVFPFENVGAGIDRPKTTDEDSRRRATMIAPT